LTIVVFVEETTLLVQAVMALQTQVQYLTIVVFVEETDLLVQAVMALQTQV
jgi:hypothetical protein